MSYPTFLNRVQRDVRDEREAQDAKWGEQNHPDGTGADYPNSRLYADAHRRYCQQAAENGNTTWRDVLSEEVYEAFAEDDPAKLREELIQIAAVAQAWIESIDRRKADTTTKEA